MASRRTFSPSHCMSWRTALQYKSNTFLGKPPEAISYATFPQASPSSVIEDKCSVTFPRIQTAPFWEQMRR